MLFDQILSLIPCSVFWKDINGVFCGCNQRFLEFAGIKEKSQLIGKTDKELSWADRWEEYYQDDQHVIASGEVITRIEEVTLIHKKITAHTTKAPWRRDGESSGVIGVIYDISELMQAKEQAESANYLKSEFVQNMQHDIRTPASGICSLLGSMVEEEEDADKKAKLLLLKSSADQLYSICNDVIDFDRAERGEIPVTVRKFSIKRLVTDVFNLNQAIALSKKLILSFNVDANVPAVVKGDKHRVSRILVNLLGNAIKFTSTGEVTLSARLVKLKDKELIVQFKLSDTGVGIPAEKINFIYEKFSRGTLSSQSSYKGSGLGLQIVKKYIADLNAEIEVDSEINKGTVFYVNIPFEKSLVEEVHEPDAQDTLPSMKKNSLENKPSKMAVNILLIEDDKLAQVAALKIIKKVGIDAVLAESVEGAIQILNQQSFDLVLSDIGLPDGVGFEIVGAIKKNPSGLNAETPFFALTAYSDRNKMTEAKSAGFTLTVPKPLTQERLEWLLDTYVSQKNRSSEDEQLHLPIIDLDFSRKFAGDEEAIQQLLDMLGQELPKDIVQIKSMQKKMDVDGLKNVFHKMSGSLSYFSAPRLQSALSKLHEEIKNNSSLIGTDELFERFYYEVDALMAEYHKIRVD